MALLDASIVSGTGRVLLALAGVAGGLWLLRPAGGLWWRRTLPVALMAGVLTGVATKVGVEDLWHPFPDALPLVVELATGSLALALVLAGARSRHARVGARLVAGLAVVLVALAGTAQVNQLFRAYPTLRSALGLPFRGQVAFSTVAAGVPAGALSLQLGTMARPLDAVWTAPPGLSATGVVTRLALPGRTSGFPARAAWVYLPPAYLTRTRPRLPVLVLLSGSPGDPRDWLTGGQLPQTMDAFAQVHRGLAPVVVSVDPLGSEFSNPVCVDSRLGRAFSYLTVDVPREIAAALQVDPDHRHWAVGGLSSGGTCSLQLAVNAPRVYPTFVDISGEDEPTRGSRNSTVAEAFGGHGLAFRRVNPLDVLAVHHLPGVAGFLSAGSRDRRYLPQALTVLHALRAAGVPTVYSQLPGGHTWQTWAPALREALPFVATRTRLIP